MVNWVFVVFQSSKLSIHQFLNSHKQAEKIFLNQGIQQGKLPEGKILEGRLKSEFVINLCFKLAGLLNRGVNLILLENTSILAQKGFGNCTELVLRKAKNLLLIISSQNNLNFPTISSPTPHTLQSPISNLQLSDTKLETDYLFRYRLNGGKNEPSRKKGIL